MIILVLFCRLDTDRDDFHKYTTKSKKRELGAHSEFLSFSFCKKAIQPSRQWDYFA